MNETSLLTRTTTINNWPIGARTSNPGEAVMHDTLDSVRHSAYQHIRLGDMVDWSRDLDPSQTRSLRNREMDSGATQTTAVEYAQDSSGVAHPTSYTHNTSDDRYFEQAQWKDGQLFSYSERQVAANGDVATREIVRNSNGTLTMTEKEPKLRPEITTTTMPWNGQAVPSHLLTFEGRVRDVMSGLDQNFEKVWNADTSRWAADENPAADVVTRRDADYGDPVFSLRSQGQSPEGNPVPGSILYRDSVNKTEYSASWKNGEVFEYHQKREPLPGTFFEMQFKNNGDGTLTSIESHLPKPTAYPRPQR